MNVEDIPEIRDALRALVDHLELDECPAIAELSHHMLGPTDGAFVPLQDDGTGQRIEIRREYSTEIPGSPLHELATLVHEAGHWQSWKTKQRPNEQEYRAAVDTPHGKWRTLPDAAKQLIYGEELTAWRLGPNALSAALEHCPVTLPKWFERYFAHRRDESLRVYRKKLRVSVRTVNRWFPP